MKCFKLEIAVLLLIGIRVSSSTLRVPKKPNWPFISLHPKKRSFFLFPLVIFCRASADLFENLLLLSSCHSLGISEIKYRRMERPDLDERSSPIDLCSSKP